MFTVCASFYVRFFFFFFFHLEIIIISLSQDANTVSNYLPGANDLALGGRRDTNVTVRAKLVQHEHTATSKGTTDNGNDRVG